MNGYGDFTPPDHAGKLDVLGGFPTTDAFRCLQRDRIRYVILHLDAYGPNARAKVLDRLRTFAPYLTARYLNDRTHLYEITGTA